MEMGRSQRNFLSRQKMLLNSCLIVILFTGSLSDVQSRWHWTWSCVNETCVKSSVPDERNGTALNFCKLFCGKYGSLWPRPTGPTWLGRELFFFHPSAMTFDYSHVEGGTGTRDYLQKMSKIFQNKLFASCGAQCALVPGTQIHINFQVNNPTLVLNWETDESYSLDISKRDDPNTNHTAIDVGIKSESVFGARHAMETIGQLTTSHALPPSRGQGKRVLVTISEAQIIDSPAYPHRGLVLDTARHFISKPAIYRTLDAMAMTKLNVFHWHVTDSQSFPLEIPSVPEMCRHGAYTPEEIYTVEDVTSVIEYAKLRGIRVIIEIDGPAHAGNGWQWGKAENLGDLALCVNQQPWRKYCIQPPCGQLNPVNPNVYGVLKSIYTDIIDLLPPGEVFHMGGDEVAFSCWNSSALVVEWMQNHQLTRDERGFLDLWGAYQRNVLRVFEESNPVPNVPIILWSSSLTEPEIIEKFLDKNRYIIETWMEAASPKPKQLLDKGYRLIMSTKDRWYLDHGFWGNTKYHSWISAYNNRLPDHPNVLGGEAAMWSERVDDNSLDVKIWPRTAAVGERLWTNPKADAHEAASRFENFRERLTLSGVNADATSPYYCYQNERACD